MVLQPQSNYFVSLSPFESITNVMSVKLIILFRMKHISPAQPERKAET